MIKKKILSLCLASVMALGTVNTSYIVYANTINGVTKTIKITDTITESSYPKISNITENTILGADFSNYQQDLIWGKTYKDYKNNDISNTLFDFVKSQGVNTISVKVSTDDKSAISLTNAIKTLKEAQKSGLKTNIVLLYSDEITYANKQDLPKAWANENDITTKACNYTKSVLEKLTEAGVKLDILTIGNEVNYNFLGYAEESSYKGWEAMAKIAAIAQNKGIKASVSISAPKFSEDIKWVLQKLNQDYLNADFDYVGVNVYPTDDTVSYINNMRKVFEEEEKTAGNKAQLYISGVKYARQDDKDSVSVYSQAKGIYEVLKAGISENNAGGVVYTGAEDVGAWTSFFDEEGKAVQSLSIFALANGLNVDNNVEEEEKDPYQYGGETGVKEQKVDIDEISTMYSSTVRGVDISSYTALKKAGVKYYNHEGKEESLIKILADNGVNYIRVRVWNDPYNEKGEAYGGGNCDVQNGLEIAEEAAKYGMKMLLDFHYSDFWADPAQQIIPKAWEADKNNSDKMAQNVYKYTKETIEKFQKTGIEVGMVQVGNEITNGMLGITTNRDLGESYKGVWGDESKSKQVNKYLSAGAKAVKEVSDALVVLQLETPNVEKYKEIMDTWERDEVYYDVLGSSFYPYWSTNEKANTPEKLKEVQKLAADYGKLFVVAETAWITTVKDADGTPNSIGEWDDTSAYEVSAQGQANMLKDLYTTLGNQDNGLGAFYWEPAWIPVKAGWNNWEYNKQVADIYGTGWSSKGAVGYFPDFKMFYQGNPAWGGSSWDNQALFDMNGYALQSLKFYKDSQAKKDDQKTVVVRLLNQDNKEIGENYIAKVKVGNTVSLNLPEVDGYNTPECNVKALSSDAEVIFVNATYTTKKDAISISSATVSNVNNKVYTGKEQKQNVVVTLSGKTLKEGKDYTVSYSDNKEIGIGKVTIKGCNDYVGTVEVNFNILPQTVKNVKTTNVLTNSLTLSWDKVDNATGYKVYKYNVSSKKYELVKTINKKSTNSVKIEKLVSATKYNYKVCAYKEVKGNTYAGAKSATATVTTKPLQSVVKLSSTTKGKVNVDFSGKVSKRTEGYEVYMATSKTGKYTLVKDTSATKMIKTGLTSKKGYYFKVRAYRKVNGKKVYSSYSTVKYIKVK